MRTPHADPIPLYREPDPGSDRAIASAIGTLVPCPGLHVHVCSEIAEIAATAPRHSVGTRMAVGRAPRWLRAVSLVA